MRRVTEIARDTPGVQHAIGLPGYSVLTSNNISNVGGMFIILAPFEERLEHGQTGPSVLAELRRRFGTILDAQVVAFGAPPVEGLGTTGGFKVQIQDRADAGFGRARRRRRERRREGQRAARPRRAVLAASAPSSPSSISRSTAPRRRRSVSRSATSSTRCRSISGSAYANDFTRFGRNWQVNCKPTRPSASSPRTSASSRCGTPPATWSRSPRLLTVEDSAGPAIVNRYNMFTAAEINGNPAPGTSSGQAIALMEEIAKQELPPGMGYRVDRAHACSRSSPATPHPSSSRSGASSSSSSCPRSTRAGRCRSRSS